MSTFAIFGVNYWPEPVGNAVYTAPYAEALAEAGHTVTVVSGYPHYPKWSSRNRRWRPLREEVRGVRVVRVPHAVPSTPSAAGRLRLEATYGLAAAAALPFIGGFDAAIGVIPALSGGLAARLAAKVRRRPYGLLVQDLVSAAAEQGGVPGAGPRVGRLVRMAERLAVRCDSVAIVARGFEKPVKALGATHVRYLPNFAVISPTSTARKVRTRLGVSEDAFLVIYSGNLGYKQDFDSVLEAAALLGRESGILFLIIGEGSQEGVIRRSVERRSLNHVRMLPLQPTEDVPNILAAADVLLAPQRPTEVDMSLPSKLTSYMTVGRPVLAAASEGSETARIVRDSGGGVVVPSGDPVAMAEALSAMLADPERRQEMGAAGRAYAAEVFDRPKALARFVEFAEQLATRG